jgi:beta-mannosidase
MIKRTLIITILVISASLYAQFSPYSNKVQLDWELEYNLPGKSRTRVTEATVPGAVQLDIAREENYGPYYYDDNWKDYLWMEDQYFTYRTEFEKPSTGNDARIFFVSGGIDYAFDVLLNGEILLHQEGMFTPVSIELTDDLSEENVLEVRIHPVPKMHPEPADRSQAAQSMKPAVSYSWDWHPRLIPSGIWQESYLEIRQESYIREALIHYTLDKDRTGAFIELDITGTQLQGQEVIWKIRDASDQVVASKIIKPVSDKLTISSRLEQLRLWWPHDHGDPYLYSSVLEVRNAENELLQIKQEYIGFREVKLVMNEGAWNEPQGFPKSRSVAPAQLLINGREIFAKGTNWVNPEIFPGIITEERYNELTDRAVEANFNMLRIWGGGIVNKEAFYRLCDEKGLMVWQEFPLACNNYRSTPEFMAVLEQEAVSIIKALRNHPCIAIWSGGNELFNSWSGMTDQSLALRKLNSLCLELDPHTPYINTSPLMGMGHGHYVFRDMDTGEEVYSLMERAHFTAYTEFGMPSPSSVEVLKTIIPSDDLWPPRPNTAWEDHHAYNAWVGNTWLMQDMIEDYFGASRSLNELVENGQLQQVEGNKANYEEARRQKPYCSMALNWCFNEPWPTAANNSLINWPNIPKPAFHAVSDACRPVLASARIQKLKWREGELFETDLFILNDRYSSLPPGRVRVKLVAEGNTELVLLDWDHRDLNPNENLEGPTARGILPRWNTDRFTLVLEVEGHPEYNSEYTLLYQSNQPHSNSTSLLNQ